MKKIKVFVTSMFMLIRTVLSIVAALAALYIFMGWKFEELAMKAYMNYIKQLQYCIWYYEEIKCYNKHYFRLKATLRHTVKEALEFAK